MATGIYVITCRANKCQYVGSTKNLTVRRYTHWANLRNGRSHNVHLQNAWNKYGANSFDFQVLEEVTDFAILIEREQYWIDKLHPQFNKAEKANSGFNKLHHSPKTIAMLSNIQRERMKDPSRREYLRECGITQAHRQVNGRKGKHCSVAQLAKLRAAAKRQFASPEAREAHSRLMRSVMSSPVIREQIRQSKIGLHPSNAAKKRKSASLKRHWASYSPEERQRRISAVAVAVRAVKAKRYDGFISPDGTIYRDVYNLTRFCKEHDLSSAKMVLVNSGKRHHHKGWRRIT